jgi:hypothetical protein
VAQHAGPGTTGPIKVRHGDYASEWISIRRDQILRPSLKGPLRPPRPFHARSYLRPNCETWGCAIIPCDALKGETRGTVRPSWTAASLFLVLNGAATAQNARPEFEVASVKLDKAYCDNVGVSGGCHGVDSRYTSVDAATPPPLSRCVLTSARIGHLVSIAWGLPMRMIEGDDAAN